MSFPATPLTGPDGDTAPIEGARPDSAPAPQARKLPLERRPEDTAVGCHGRAEQSMVAAAAMDTVNGRQRMETSAATWTARAELLGRLEAKQAAREDAAATQEGLPRL